MQQQPRYSEQDKNNFTRKFINDPVYGGIGLSRVEVDLVNTPAFQRLRHLKQLGFSSYVFPGGEHSRFVHSLGVLYIMGRMCSHLEASEMHKPADKRNFSPEDTFKLRIAALLHDIGHYPLSHLGESVYTYEKMQQGGQTSASDWGAEENGETGTKKEPTPPGTDTKPLMFDIVRNISKEERIQTHHERLGEIVVMHNRPIKEILIAAGLNPSEIADIFTRGANIPKNIIYYNLLHSSLDADRLDYLMRDSAQTGVKFGMVDLDYLIRLMIVKTKKIRIEDVDVEVRMIAFNKKGQHVIEHFLMCRFFHYAQVVNHRTAGSFEMIAKVIFFKLLQNRRFLVNSADELFKPLPGGEYFVNSNKFLRFNDDEWWHAIHEMNEHTSDDIFHTFYRMLIERIPPQTIYFARDILSFSAKSFGGSETKEQYFIRKRAIIKHLPDLAKRIELDPEKIGYTLSKSTIEKDAHKFKSETIDIHNEEMMDCIKMADPACPIDECTLLAKDETSMIGQIASLYAESICVFYIPSEGDKFERDTVKNRFRDLLDE